MKVYLASEGSYSDYAVIAVFLNKEDAQKVSLNEVEEMELYESVPEKVSGWVMKAMPYTEDWHERFVSYWPWEVWLPMNDRPTTHVWDYGYRRDGGGYSKAIRASGKDRESVRKAFYDRVAQLKAEDAGIA